MKYDTATSSLAPTIVRIPIWLYSSWDSYVKENKLSSHGLICWNPTGSYYTCKDNSKANDIDVVCFVRDPIKFADSIADKFISTAVDSYRFFNGESSFLTFRGKLGAVSKEYNLIVTTDNVFYSRFVAATLLTKQLDIEKKEDRIAMFKLVMGDKT